MTEQKPPRNGLDFAIGFFGSILLVTTVSTVSGLLSKLLPNIMTVALGLVSLMINLSFFIVGPIVAFRRKRKFIGIGILAALIAVPLLLMGSCFAIAILK